MRLTLPGPSRRVLQTGAFVVVAGAGWACWWWSQRRPTLRREAIQSFRDWDRQQLRLNGMSLDRNLEDVDALDEYGDEEDDEGAPDSRGKGTGASSPLANGATPNRSGFREMFAMIFPGLAMSNKAWAAEHASLQRSASASSLAKLVKRQKASRENLLSLGREMAAVQRPSVCFQGSGCVLVFHIGVGRYLQEHFHLDDVCFLGASGGAIIAAMCALGFSMELAMAENLRVSRFSRQWPFGPFGRILNDVADAFDAMLEKWTDDDVRLVLSGLQPMIPLSPELRRPGSGVGRSLESWRVFEEVLPLPPPQRRPDPPFPKDAAPTAAAENGSPRGNLFGGSQRSPKPPPPPLAPWRNRLVLSLTHAATWAPRLMRHFPTKQALRDSVWSSMNLPIFLCRFRGVCGAFYLDGGLTNNAPVLNPQTVRVSPTDAEADVRPDAPASAKEFLVPGDGAYMVAMHDQGYEAARRCHALWLSRGFRPLTQPEASH